ncbi:hypothetical protein lpari_01776 [Legionella parisiensis]|uniref:Uncharacterized protein n=1 Tax=Legionella parisiensis TaxID=45071 RepID=A0A1E5JRZ5_9GAMM|nr:hypothetical protein [Legionella parisiensis]OEH47294.1 hypothetical protein lpari_01776 [Legionella parisiensis]
MKEKIIKKIVREKALKKVRDGVGLVPALDNEIACIILNMNMMH